MSERLIIIGGAEDKEKGKEILKYISSRIPRDGLFVIATVATEDPDIVKHRYSKLFKGLGVKNIGYLDIRTREDGLDEENINIVDKADLIFFTGGDQLRITSLLGGTLVNKSILDAKNRGCWFVGTSAGASVMSSTMIIGGKDEESPRKCTIEMAPGLGLIQNVIIDQHFSQRGRIGRLLAAVAQNPEILGVGIDEDTAIVINNDNVLNIIGNGSVYIVDGSDMNYSNASEQYSDEILSMYNVKLHVLKKGNSYDLKLKIPFEEEKHKNEKNQ